MKKKYVILPQTAEEESTPDIFLFLHNRELGPRNFTVESA